MKQPKRYLITAALPYANGLKHIGHLAGAYLPADIYVRYLRAQKRDVVFVCGSDEHGTAIPIQATKEGTTAQAIIDKYHPIIEQNFNDLGISFDIYHRTSSPIHHETASEFFTALNNKGDLITKESEQYYDEQAQSFLADRYIKGTCPNCGFQAAYGDQCESCGKSLSPDELINPVSTLSGNTPVKKLTKHWYLPLDRHEDFLRKWIIEEHGNDWRSTVVGQCKSWIDGGLQPRAVTRDLDWGVALPNDVEGGKGKVLYVWFDAPIGYISATKQWALNTGKDWRPYWEDQDTKLIHFIGKDNIVFHCIIFPVMLQLHGNILPTNVPANEFMNLEGDKMSTSRNWKLEMADNDKLALEENLATSGSCSVGNHTLTRAMIKFTRVRKTVYEEVYTPSVIEPAFGMGRVLFCILEHSFRCRDDLNAAASANGLARCYLALPPVVAPVKVSVLPISAGADEGITAMVEEISHAIAETGLSFKVDDSGQAIGRRYARTDEIGIPFGITVDFESLKDKCVTLRERDSMEQVRLPAKEVVRVTQDLSTGRAQWAQVRACYPLFGAADDQM